MATSGSAKGRKFGRHKDRSPSMAQYRNGNRMAKNKAKKIAKHAKQVAKNAIKVTKVARGTARAKRRGSFH
jgi:hypothetical protein